MRAGDVHVVSRAERCPGPGPARRDAKEAWGGEDYAQTVAAGEPSGEVPDEASKETCAT